MSEQSVSDHARQYAVYHEKCMQAQGKLPNTLAALNKAMLDLKGVDPSHEEWPVRRAEVVKLARTVAMDDTIQAGPLIHVRQILRILGSHRTPPTNALRAIDDLAPVATRFLPRLSVC